jgi:hypothetical protein
VVKTETAHMCTSEELVRTRQAGLPVSAGGWFAQGLDAFDGSRHFNDCAGWLDGSDASGGAMWGGTRAATSFCGTSQPILCCD